MHVVLQFSPGKGFSSVYLSLLAHRRDRNIYIPDLGTLNIKERVFFRSNHLTSHRYHHTCWHI